MALCDVGPIVQTISGNLGATCFASGRGSTVARMRQGRSGTRVARQGGRQIIFVRAEAQWAALSEADARAWANLAASIQRPDRLGRMRPLTGRQLFVAMSVRNQMALSTSTTPLPAGRQFAGWAALLLSGWTSASMLATIASLDNTSARYCFFQGAVHFGPTLPRVWRRWRHLGALTWASGSAGSYPPYTTRTYELATRMILTFGPLKAGTWICIRALEHSRGANAPLTSQWIYQTIQLV